jgi:hypothetical protein
LPCDHSDLIALTLEFHRQVLRVPFDSPKSLGREPMCYLEDSHLSRPQSVARASGSCA